MIEEKLFTESLPMLKHLGFTEYETRVYLALLFKKKCSATEAAKISGVPRNIVYSVLNGLERKGGCLLLQGQKKYFEAVNPDILTERAKSKLEEYTSDIETSIASSTVNFANLVEASIDANDGLNYVTVINDPITLANCILESVSRVKEEVLIFSTSAELGKTLSEKDKLLRAEISKKEEVIFNRAVKELGVSYRCVATPGTYTPGFIDYLSDPYLLLDNVDFRIADDIPCKGFIHDNYEIFIALRSRFDNEVFSGSYFYIKDRGLATFLKAAFETYYAKGTSLKDIDLEVLKDTGELIKR